MYAAGDLPAGNTLRYTLSGIPKETSTSSSTSTSELNPNRSILFGAAALGLALILAGAWIYIRDHQKVEENNYRDEGEEFTSPEEVMDAIIALDDLHQAKRISHESYQKRRNELKEILRNELKD